MGLGDRMAKSGIESMLASMGIDVPDMMKKFEVVQQYIVSVDERLANLEKQNEKILSLLAALEVVEETEQPENAGVNSNGSKNASGNHPSGGSDGN